MGDGSAIEWTDATWNPIVGCEAVSPGCDHCYAATLVSTRLRNVPVYAGLACDGKFSGEIRLVPERLDQPLRWRKPRRIFVNSMSDLFHRDVPAEFIERVFDVMAEADHHSYQVLTKRPQRMADLFFDGGYQLAHCEWLGTSIENDRYTFRADHLRRIPCAVRFLSCEPLLGPLASLDLAGIDWVIVGGESGPGARPMHPEWVTEIRDRCVAAGVPFFFKQAGAVLAREWECEHRAGGNMAEWPEEFQVREYPDA